jgi:hypothetical protein
LIDNLLIQVFISFLGDEDEARADGTDLAVILDDRVRLATPAPVRLYHLGKFNILGTSFRFEFTDFANVKRDAKLGSRAAEPLPPARKDAVPAPEPEKVPATVPKKEDGAP